MPAGGSNNDDERARRAAAELKETEDLLAGFDRPGRTPRVPPVKRDFVDYHLGKRRSSPPPRPSPVPHRAARDLPTAIIPGQKRKLPSWVPWAVLLLVMSVLGVLVAAAVSGPPIYPQATSLPGTTTTLASGTPTFDPTTGPARDIPPPPSSAAEAPSAEQTERETKSETAPTPPKAQATTTATATATVARTTTPASSATQRTPPSATTAPQPSATTAPSATVDLIRNL